MAFDTTAKIRQEISDLQTNKADRSDLAAINSELDGLGTAANHDAGDFDAAGAAATVQSNLDTTNTQVSTNTAAIAANAAAILTKAAQSAVDALSSSLSALSTLVDTKAAQSDLTTLSASVSALADSLSGYATTTSLSSGLSSLSTTITNHVADHNNPHAVTKSQVGLGNVLNVDCTNAANITGGVFDTSRIPSLSYLPLSGGTLSGELYGTSFYASSLFVDYTSSPTLETGQIDFPDSLTFYDEGYGDMILQLNGPNTGQAGIVTNYPLYVYADDNQFSGSLFAGSFSTTGTITANGLATLTNSASITGLTTITKSSTATATVLSLKHQTSSSYASLYGLIDNNGWGELNIGNTGGRYMSLNGYSGAWISPYIFNQGAGLAIGTNSTSGYGLYVANPTSGNGSAYFAGAVACNANLILNNSNLYFHTVDSNHRLYYDSTVNGPIVRGYAGVKLMVYDSGALTGATVMSTGLTVDKAVSVGTDLTVNGNFTTASTTSTQSTLLQTSDLFGDYVQARGLGYITAGLTITMPAGKFAVIRGKRVVTSTTVFTLPANDSGGIWLDTSGVYHLVTGWGSWGYNSGVLNFGSDPSNGRYVLTWQTNGTGVVGVGTFYLSVDTALGFGSGVLTSSNLSINFNDGYGSATLTSYNGLRMHTIQGNFTQYWGTYGMTVNGMTINGYSGQTADYFAIKNTAGNTLVNVDTSGSLRVTDSAGASTSGITPACLILTSPSGTQYGIYVDDSGNLTTASL